MSLVVSILFGKKIHDINSTPNIINKNIFEHITNIPKDFSFDLFCYILATKRKYKILRYNINIKKDYMVILNGILVSSLKYIFH